MRVLARASEDRPSPPSAVAPRSHSELWALPPPGSSERPPFAPDIDPGATPPPEGPKRALPPPGEPSPPEELPPPAPSPRFAQTLCAPEVSSWRRGASPVGGTGGAGGVAEGSIGLRALDPEAARRLGDFRSFFDARSMTLEDVWEWVLDTERTGKLSRDVFNARMMGLGWSYEDSPIVCMPAVCIAVYVLFAVHRPCLKGHGQAVPTWCGSFRRMFLHGTPQPRCAIGAQRC